jgi:hypothetical protein
MGRLTAKNWLDSLPKLVGQSAKNWSDGLPKFGRTDKNQIRHCSCKLGLMGDRFIITWSFDFNILRRQIILTTQLIQGHFDLSFFTRKIIFLS